MTELLTESQASELLDRPALAKFLGVRPNTIYAWYRRGQLPKPFLVVGRSAFWKPSQFDGWKSPAALRVKS